jgi:hypothetical protein
VAKIIKSQDIDMNANANVYIGWDTRYHSPVLSRAVVNGVIALKGNMKEYGIVTTPMLHFFVVAHNTKGGYGPATEVGYISKLVNAFKKLRGDQLERGNYKNFLLFDGANGVGSLKQVKNVRFRNESNVFLTLFVYLSAAGVQQKTRKLSGLPSFQLERQNQLSVRRGFRENATETADGDARSSGQHAMLLS